jgi:hypothetical protein
VLFEVRLFGFEPEHRAKGSLSLAIDYLLLLEGKRVVVVVDDALLLSFDSLL